MHGTYTGYLSTCDRLLFYRISWKMLSKRKKLEHLYTVKALEFSIGVLTAVNIEMSFFDKRSRTDCQARVYETTSALLV